MMALVSISEAAKLCGKDRKTLYRYIKDGKLSATIATSGTRQVDVSEIIRVFGALQQSRGTGDSGETVAMPQHETPNLAAKIVALEAENTQLKERLGDKERHIEDMRNAVRLLEHKTKSSFWKRLFG
jgi:predicted RNase H-like nuclease (RuvC/YqgF family)